MCPLRQLSVCNTCPEAAQDKKPAIDSGLVVMLAPGCKRLQQATRPPECILLAAGRSACCVPLSPHTPYGPLGRVLRIETAAADIDQAQGATPVLCISRLRPGSQPQMSADLAVVLVACPRVHAHHMGSVGGSRGAGQQLQGGSQAQLLGGDDSPPGVGQPLPILAGKVQVLVGVHSHQHLHLGTTSVSAMLETFSIFLTCQCMTFMYALKTL